MHKEYFGITIDLETIMRQAKRKVRKITDER
jgi:hypothetical protein